MYKTLRAYPEHHDITILCDIFTRQMTALFGQCISIQQSGDANDLETYMRPYSE